MYTGFLFTVKCPTAPQPTGLFESALFAFSFYSPLCLSLVIVLVKDAMILVAFITELVEIH